MLNREKTRKGVELVLLEKEMRRLIYHRNQSGEKRTKRTSITERERERKAEIDTV